MRGHWPCRLIEFVLLAFGPCRGLFNFAWGGQSIMRDEAPSLIAPQNHYRSVEGPWAASGRTRQRWSRLPGDQIQFALWAALELWAISQGWGWQSHERRTANCLCLAWQPSPSQAGGTVASSAPGWIFLHWQRNTSCPQRENLIFKVQYIFTPL